MHISLVNIDAHKPQAVSLDLGEVRATTVSGRILQADALQAHNSFARPNNIQPTAFGGARLEGNTLTATLPPFSVVVLQLQ